MTDKEFVKSVYPNVICDNQWFFNMTGKIGYAIFENSLEPLPRKIISLKLANTENTAWYDMAIILRNEFLTKLES